MSYATFDELGCNPKKKLIESFDEPVADDGLVYAGGAMVSKDQLPYEPEFTIREDKRCGPKYNNAICGEGKCCSKHGWCGGKRGEKSGWCHGLKKTGNWRGIYDDFKCIYKKECYHYCKDKKNKIRCIRKCIHNCPEDCDQQRVSEVCMPKCLHTINDPEKLKDCAQSCLKENC